ncbi:LacI family DNA-binding transcriptional regulator [Aurantiacibacter xanthus]|uniref:LacI family DNA-binding transcriptional regulator n=1 Tax=Aurantiacibacter xanthus TaxID=1784712 RepID=A0A3A1P5F9_9SPHN|nr:LacI family DNA-binding transcriptional regulator [Aurantiacibacter xanthus]RIV82350.1 LacI family DNA-binding transcriptional regulator [Aurantiacibacter xanthus]
MARRRQSVTIKHVAADAGVSLQTVSRVINDEPNVRPAMKERVQASIDKLGYIPSIAARRMSGSRSYLILALNDRERTIADWQARGGNDWVDQMLLGGMLKCAELGYRMIFELVDTHSDHVERELNAALVALEPDGVILTPPHSDNPLITTMLAKRKVPFARIGSIGNGGGIPLVMGDEGAARMASEYLADLGHTRIGFIAGPRDYQLSAWRKDGWLAVMRERGLPHDDLCVRGDFGYESGVACARALLALPERPTAIIASSDQMTFAAMDVAQQMGLAIPADLSLISFDNTPAAKLRTPSLTAIDQPVAATMSRAVELLIAANRGEDPPGESEVIEPGLIVRESTAAPTPSA